MLVRSKTIARWKYRPIWITLLTLVAYRWSTTFSSKEPRDCTVEGLTQLAELKFGAHDLDLQFDPGALASYSETNKLFNGNFKGANQRETLDRTSRVLLKNVLQTDVVTSFRDRVTFLESRLSALSQNDLRWCSRYCKNLFYFSAGSRLFATTVVTALADLFNWSDELYILNDELSYNVPGEAHDYNWHLDLGAWAVIPQDAWAVTVYIPLDTAFAEDGGGWLRFKTLSQEEDIYFSPGDILVFDRFIIHKLADFVEQKKSRAAYLIRVTNSSQVVDPGYTARSIPKLTNKVITSGAHINHICGADITSCRMSVKNFVQTKSYRHPIFELNLKNFLAVSSMGEDWQHIQQRAFDIFQHMCLHFMH